MNPPYSEIGKFMRFAREQHEKHNVDVLILAYAKVDTKWWHDYVEGRSEIHNIKGRIRFNCKHGYPKDNVAPYPSCWIIWRKTWILNVLQDAGEEQILAEYAGIVPSLSYTIWIGEQQIEDPIQPKYILSRKTIHIERHWARKSKDSWRLYILRRRGSTNMTGCKCCNCINIKALSINFFHGTLSSSQGIFTHCKICLSGFMITWQKEKRNEWRYHLQK